MTTHDQYPDAPRTDDVPTLTEVEPTTRRTDSPREQSERSATAADPASAPHESYESTEPSGGGSTVESAVVPDDSRHAAVEGADSNAPAEVSQAEPSSEASLFADGELAGLRARWNDVQASFVDDPRDCVHKADGLVSDVVEQLTTGFTEARSRLEQQWGRGEEASTEDLRVALKRYREFFERLLAV